MIMFHQLLTTSLALTFLFNNQILFLNAQNSILIRSNPVGIRALFILLGSAFLLPENQGACDRSIAKDANENLHLAKRS